MPEGRHGEPLLLGLWLPMTLLGFCSDQRAPGTLPLGAYHACLWSFLHENLGFGHLTLALASGGEAGRANGRRLLLTRRSIRLTPRSADPNDLDRRGRL